MKAKEKILQSALSLFNEKGTGVVSTNHIAEEAGISPGNLYYHFANKEAIIRALFEQVFEQWDTRLNLPADRLPRLEDLKALVATNFHIMADYRFIYRELVALLHQDPELKARYLSIRQRGYEGFHEILLAFMHAEVLQTLDEATIHNLADLVWLISESWLTNIELSGKLLDEAQMQHGTELMMQVLRPYLKQA